MAAAAAIEATHDQSKLEAFVAKMLNDLGATMNEALVIIGDRLGLYKALAERGPARSHELALRTGTTERYVREWLAAQAASGYVTYDSATKKYSLTSEQAAVFADENSPVFFAGAFDICAAAFRDEPKITAAFKSGRGVGWHEHHQCLFCGTERFFRPGYNAHLVGEWLPALDGVVDKLKNGARVADVGCGHGASTIIMAQAFPNSRFEGFDYHGPSIQHARTAAEEASVADRVTFEEASAKDTPREAMTSSVSSIACTTWAIRSAPPSMFGRRSRPVGPGWWSSPSPRTGSRTTSTRWGACITPPRPYSARRPPSPRRWDWPSARRRARRGSRT
jgi:Methyltransferase domain